MKITKRKPTKVTKVAKRTRDQFILDEMGVSVHVAGDPWDQQWGETAPAFAAFVLYRDMGPNRKVSEVGKLLGKKPFKWSAEWSWQNRARAYDNHLDAIVQKEHEREVKLMGRRQARLGVAMQQLADKRLHQFADSVELQATMSVNDVVKLAVEGSKIERVAAGEDKQQGTQITFVIGMQAAPKWLPPSLKAAGEPLPMLAPPGAVTSGD